MSKGFIWFAQNNDKVDYVEISIKLAESIKKHNRENNICVITDEKSKFENKFVIYKANWFNFFECIKVCYNSNFKF